MAEDAYGFSYRNSSKRTWIMTLDPTYSSTTTSTSSDPSRWRLRRAVSASALSESPQPTSAASTTVVDAVRGVSAIKCAVSRAAITTSSLWRHAEEL